MKSTQAPKVYRSLDLFCGCGGLSYGLSLARGQLGSHIQVAGAMDLWEAACHTYEKNLGLKPVCVGVTKESVTEILREVGSVDLVVGGPPCQGFSTVGKRALDDPRNGLVKAYLDAIEIAQPRAFLMENVTGFTTFQSGSLMREVMNAASSLGYRIKAGIVLASLHGVPQRRRRFIMVGTRSVAFCFPNETLVAPAGLELAPKVSLAVDESPDSGEERWTFDDATSDLPALKAGERNDSYLTGPQNALQEWLRGDAVGPIDHVAVGHKATFVEMMSYIPEGKSAMDPEVMSRIPAHLRPTSGYPNSYARIRGDRPSPTITRNFTTPSSANCIHPHQDRALSLREGARCQTFPDWYDFTGSSDDKRLQIGNAVPPLLAKELGSGLLNAMEEEHA